MPRCAASLHPLALNHQPQHVELPPRDLLGFRAILSSMFPNDRKDPASVLVSGKWSAARPNVLVVACSDGRLQEATDAFLATQLGVVRYDRFYVPGGAGALVPSGYDFVRAQQMRRECRYLIKLHDVGKVVLLMHGPAAGGGIEAACADYRRKLPRASVDQLREQQVVDASQLLQQRTKWAGLAAVSSYRCEVDVSGAIAFVDLAASSASSRVKKRVHDI